MTFWFNKQKQSISLNWYRKYAKRNKAEYGNSDPDMRTGMVWGFHSNGAKKGNLKDTCYDCSLALGYLEIGYTNWDFNKSSNIVHAKRA